MPGIQHMPIEILQKIFIYGCEIDEDPVQSGAYGRPKKPPYLSSAKGSWPIRQPQLKSFANAPQCVCQMWKRIVSSTPELWYIEYVVGSRFHDIKPVENAIDTSKIEIDLHLTENMDMKSEQAARAFTRLLRNRSRLRMIDATTPSGDRLGEYLTFINNLEKLSNLEFLRVHITWPKVYALLAQRPPTPSELMVLMPALRISTCNHILHLPLHVTPRNHAPQSGDNPRNPHLILWKTPDAPTNPHLRCLHLDMLWYTTVATMLPSELPTLNLPFLVGLRIISTGNLIVLDLLSRTNLPRLTSVVISCGFSGQIKGEFGANFRVYLPSLEILRIGGPSSITFARQLMKYLIAPKLRAIQVKISVVDQLNRVTTKVADIKGRFADQLARETQSHYMGSVVELCQMGDDEHRLDHAVITCCGQLALDLLGFFPRIDISGLTIRASPCCREGNLDIYDHTVAVNSGGPLGNLKFFCMADYRGDQLSLLSQQLWQRGTSACLRPPESTAMLSYLLKRSPAETLHFVLVQLKLELLKPLAQLDTDVTSTFRSRVFQWINPPELDPKTPKPRAIVAPNLRHLRFTLKPSWTSETAKVGDSALLDILIIIINARKSTDTPLESLTLERRLLPRFDTKLAAHCERNTVRYFVGETDCAMHCRVS